MNFKKILEELKHHSPFTALATLLAVVIIFITTKSSFFNFVAASENLFEIIHPAHILFAAITTSAIFYKYKKNKINAIILGIIGSVAIGSLSDVIFTWLEAKILLTNASFHLPALEEPLLIFGTAIIGGIIGLFMINTKLSHSLHIFLSVFASLFYLLAFASSSGLVYYIEVFFMVFIAVIAPCCTSDIILPLLFAKGKNRL